MVICRDIIQCMDGANNLALALAFGVSSLVVVGERQADIYPSVSLTMDGYCVFTGRRDRMYEAFLTVCLSFACVSAFSATMAAPFTQPISRVLDRPRSWLGRAV